MTRVQTGSCWTGSTLYKAGHLDTPLCPHCGAKRIVEHIVWHCPKHSELRGTFDPLLAELGPIHLPPPLLHGIAPALHHLSEHTFWGTPLSYDQPDANTLFGALPFPPDVHYPLHGLIESYPGLNTRQLFDRIR